MILLQFEPLANIQKIPAAVENVQATTRSRRQFIRRSRATGPASAAFKPPSKTSNRPRASIPLSPRERADGRGRLRPRGEGKNVRITRKRYLTQTLPLHLRPSALIRVHLR